jgi:hypothetical protein
LPDVAIDLSLESIAFAITVERDRGSRMPDDESFSFDAPDGQLPYS